MGTPRPDAVVTFEAFNRLEHGMSYEIVCKVLGCAGNVLFRIGGVGGVPETVMYSWNGEGVVGANMNATFKDGKLTSKAQFGMDHQTRASSTGPVVTRDPRSAPTAGELDA